jgi:hypothetical protein
VRPAFFPLPSCLVLHWHRLADTLYLFSLTGHRHAYHQRSWSYHVPNVSWLSVLVFPAKLRTATHNRVLSSLLFSCSLSTVTAVGTLLTTPLVPTTTPLAT